MKPGRYDELEELIQSSAETNNPLFYSALASCDWQGKSGENGLSGRYVRGSVVMTRV